MSVGNQLYDWYKDRASQMGVPVTSLMIMAMSHYADQREQVPALTDIIRQAIETRSGGSSE